jgi:cell division protein ZapA
MTIVEVAVGGRRYAVSCAPGEERHLELLAQMVDERLVRLSPSLSRNEAKSLLLAALVLADELHDLRRSTGDDELTGALEALADAVESQATALEQRSGTS